jgi:integrase
MSSAFTSAVRWQLVSINPVRATEAPAKKVLDMHVPSAAELITLMEAAQGTVWEVPIMLAATTGAHRGEVAGLRWGNVDLDRGRIRIVEALQRVNRELVYAPPKTPRAVPQHPDSRVGDRSAAATPRRTSPAAARARHSGRRQPSSRRPGRR